MTASREKIFAARWCPTAPVASSHRTHWGPIQQVTVCTYWLLLYSRYNYLLLHSPVASKQPVIRSFERWRRKVLGLLEFCMNVHRAWIKVGSSTMWSYVLDAIKNATETIIFKWFFPSLYLDLHTALWSGLRDLQYRKWLLVDVVVWNYDEEDSERSDITHHLVY